MINSTDLYRENKGIPRPTGFMENPFIGKDGRDYHSYEALKEANEAYFERMFQEKPVRTSQ
jgi:hypothetical protein